MKNPFCLRALLLLLTAAIVPACGGGGGGGGGSPRTASSGGGRAGGGTTGAIVGGNGGAIQAFSEGNIRVGVNPAPAAPILPAVPGGTAIDSSDLTGVAFTQPTGSILIAGTVETPGAGGDYTINATLGDIVITGTLLAGDPGAGGPDNLILNAPVGTVYITGSLLTRNSDGTADGDSGGGVTIAARRIIVTGTIDTSAESNNAGDGGEGGTVEMSTGGFAVTVEGGDILIVGGRIVTSGGNGTTGVAAAAGDGGDLEFGASGEVRIHADIVCRGGSVNGSADLATGGDGGTVLLEGVSGVAVNGSLDLTGGRATTSGDGAAGGSGGTLLGQFILSNAIQFPSGPVALYGTLVNPGGAATAGTGTNAITGGDGGVVMIGGAVFVDAGNRAPASIDLATANWDHRGGDSEGIAGAGGAAGGFVPGDALGNDHVRPGSVQFEGTVDVSNGNGGTNSPGDALFFLGTTMGDIFLRGNVRVGGGSASGDLTADGQSGTVQLLTGVMSSPLSFGSIFVQARINVDGGNSTGDRGARGGNIQFDCIGPVGGSVTIEPGSVLTANGGRGAGSGAGGSGGRLAISTLDDAVSISGTYTARGGNAGAGTGGDGGFVEVLTDDDNDDLGGAITIQTGAVLDISGGAGTIGGSARNGILNEAVILDADGLNGDDPANGIVINNGSIIARGGNPDGAGGDVIFDGLKANGTADPLPGLQDLDGAGPTPTNGTFQAF